MKTLLMTAVLLFAGVASADVCFNARQVRSYETQGFDLILKMRGNTQVRVQTFACPELNWAHRIGFRTFAGSRVCRGDSVVLMDAFGRRLDECRIHTITRY